MESIFLGLELGEIDQQKICYYFEYTLDNDEYFKMAINLIPLDNFLIMFLLSRTSRMTDSNFELFLNQDIDFDNVEYFFKMAMWCKPIQLREYMKKMKNVNLVNEEGTLLHHLVLHPSGMKKKLEIALELGVDYNITDSQLKTPLYYASIDEARILVKYGARYDSDKQYSIPVRGDSNEDCNEENKSEIEKFYDLHKCRE